MPHNDPHETSPLKGPFLAARRALAALAPEGSLPLEREPNLPSMIEELADQVDLARDLAAGHLGPAIHWSEPNEERPVAWDPLTLVADFDFGDSDEPMGISRVRRFDDSGFHLAARAYRRDAGWDHTPGEAGLWLLHVVPYRSSEGSTVFYSGTLAGFAILYDRDDDEVYETLGHVWTAKEWRRRGIATGLVREAKSRFGVREVEGTSAEGSAFLKASAPDLLA